jgi:hypothetical protein
METCSIRAVEIAVDRSEVAANPIIKTDERMRTSVPRTVIFHLIDPEIVRGNNEIIPNIYALSENYSSRQQ